MEGNGKKEKPRKIGRRDTRENRKDEEKYGKGEINVKKGGEKRGER